MQLTTTAILELGFQYNHYYKYYYMDFGPNNRLGIVDRDGFFQISTKPFDYQQLSILENVGQLRWNISQAERRTNVSQTLFLS